MIFKNIELYNVSEVIKTEEGYDMLRVPQCVEQHMSEKGQPRNRYSSGCEIRLVCTGDEVKIKFGTKTADFLFVYVYYGSIPAGWQDCRKVITKEGEITVTSPNDIEKLQAITKENNFPFDPNVVRIILPNSPCTIVGVEGDCRPPKAEEVPSSTYLAYGSSITHGSLSLLPMNSYASRIAEYFGANLINLGFAGSALLEPEMADYIASRDDWDFASLEMGVNAIGMPCDEFEKRVRYMISTIAGKHPDKKVFCIDVFYLYAEKGLDKEKFVKAYRRIVRKVTKELGLNNVVHLNGERMLSIGSAGISGDFTHPNIRGCEDIAQNVIKAMKKHLY
ncbi:MAG: SGNH/GDSL hydrolase family protein [Eubacteriales bacterium]|nr:SGNH/GDSL hydrolase family protein [Eubacteriales bacterium]